MELLDWVGLDRIEFDINAIQKQNRCVLRVGHNQLKIQFLAALIAMGTDFLAVQTSRTSVPRRHCCLLIYCTAWSATSDAFLVYCLIALLAPPRLRAVL